MGTLARNGLGSAGRHVVMRKWFSFKVAATLYKSFPVHLNPLYLA